MIPKLLLKMNSTAYQVPTAHQCISWIIALNLQNYSEDQGELNSMSSTHTHTNPDVAAQVCNPRTREADTWDPWSLLASPFSRIGELQVEKPGFKKENGE